MKNNVTSARTAAKTTFKSSLLFRPAQLAAILMLVAVFFVRCSDPVSSFYDLKTPIVVVGTDAKSIVVVDSNNKYLVIPDGYYLANALSKYKVGDTIIYARQHIR